jgi:uncharacterized phage protein (TIGR01671 family)
MKREILFRGKRKDGGGWVSGDLEHLSYETITIQADMVDPETVGQYTGLADKNGVKIFEGDIVETKLNGTDDPRLVSFLGEENREVIEYRKGAFGTKTVNLSDDNYSFEIIGNIHDNPGLLSRG